jgi:hypothetical protein
VGFAAIRLESALPLQSLDIKLIPPSPSGCPALGLRLYSTLRLVSERSAKEKRVNCCE